MSSLDQRLGRMPGSTETRRANLSPESYDAQERTVRAILSAGASVKRMYGTEVLQITPSAVNLDRLQTCGVPLIDSHNIFGLDGVLGNLERAWFKDKKLLGLIRFDDGEAGRQAEGLVARGAVRGVSIGYRVDKWKVTDADGNVIDPERCGLTRITLSRPSVGNCSRSVWSRYPPIRMRLFAPFNSQARRRARLCARERTFARARIVCARGRSVGVVVDGSCMKNGTSRRPVAALGLFFAPCSPVPRCRAPRGAVPRGAPRDLIDGEYLSRSGPVAAE